VEKQQPALAYLNLSHVAITPTLVFGMLVLAYLV
jgi:hypothetical protein